MERTQCIVYVQVNAHKWVTAVLHAVSTDGKILASYILLDKFFSF